MDQDPDGIIAHSPLLEEECSMPFRFVLRDMGTEYVVHVQVIPKDGEPHFHTGNYFQKRDAPVKALHRAWNCFVKRTNKYMGV
jgi:hypothetical protein